MPFFKYTVLNKAGKKIAGSLEAATLDKAASSLQGMGYNIIELKPAIVNFLGQFFSRRRVKVEELLMFTLQLRSLLAAGIPLSQSLAILQEEMENPFFREIIIQILKDLQEGQALAVCLGRYPKVFSQIYISMIAAGETSGNLEAVLEKIAYFVQRQVELTQKISTALFYPLILLGFGLLVVLYLVLFVFPQFIKIFQEVGVPLPLPTRILYGLNVLLRASWPLFLLMVVAVIFSFRVAWRRPLVREKTERIIYKIPVIGNLLLKTTLARFAWSLAALLGAGISLLEALEITGKVVGSIKFSRILSEVSCSVSKGSPIAMRLAESKEFPPLVVQMVKVGEEAGNLPEMLDKVAAHYDMLVDYGVKKMTALIEPLALLCIGGAVAFIFASLILPIFKMVNVLRH